MTDFEKAMKELASVEHSNDNSKVLHKNSTELGLTFWGIYQSANPNLPIWNIIERYLMILCLSLHGQSGFSCLSCPCNSKQGSGEQSPSQCESRT